MKISVDVDCTPEEARTFFGLPNVKPVNDMIVAEMTKRTKENMETLSDPVRFWERAMSSGGAGMEAMSQMFAAGMGEAGSPKSKG